MLVADRNKKHDFQIQQNNYDMHNGNVFNV